MPLNNLANVYYRLGDYAKATEFHERALAIKLKIFGEEHADTADSLNNLGSVYQDLGDDAKAKEFYERALTIKLKIFGEEHADTAISLAPSHLLWEAKESKYSEDSQSPIYLPLKSS
jgi:tetratricopeptide (TPR) repeat protein